MSTRNVYLPRNSFSLISCLACWVLNICPGPFSPFPDVQRGKRNETWRLTVWQGPDVPVMSACLSQYQRMWTGDVLKGALTLTIVPKGLKIIDYTQAAPSIGLGRNMRTISPIARLIRFPHSKGFPPVLTEHRTPFPLYQSNTIHLYTGIQVAVDPLQFPT